MLRTAEYDAGEPDGQAVDLPPAAGAPSLEPDPVEAERFLRAIRPTGLIALAGIVPDGPCRGETFVAQQDALVMQDWIALRQGRENTYFTLNEPIAAELQQGKNGRLRENDIAFFHGIVVDLDPNPDAEMQPGGFDNERKRLRQTAEGWLTEAGGASAVVNSGGGYQGIWLFREKVPATTESRSRIKALQRSMSRAYDGDTTPSVEHLFRTPWTINLPNAEKRRRGRTAKLAKAQLVEPRRWHTLEDLEARFPPAAEPEDAAPVGSLDVSTALGVLDVAEYLDPELAQRIQDAEAENPVFRKMLATPAEKPHRSEHDYALAAACIEAGFDDPLDVAHIVAAYSPEKTEERGPRYLARTVERAFQRVRPARPEEHFERIVDVDLAATGGEPAAVVEPADIFGDDDPGHLGTPPVGCLPDIMQRFVSTEAQRKGVPDSFVIGATLAVVGGAIGNALRIRPKRHDNWEAPGALAVVVVGSPGRKKSPTINAALAPLRAIDREQYARCSQQRRTWEAANKPGRNRPPSAATPAPPMRQALVDDATLEKQVRIHADNPRGILRAPDELVAFLGAMGAYKRSGDGDRGTVLRMLDGGPINVDRVGGSVRAPSALMGLIASTQPDKIRELTRNLGSDGLLQRLIFIVDDGSDRVGLDVPPDAAALADYEAAIRGLYALDECTGGAVRLSAEAYEILQQTWQRIRALGSLPGASAAWEGHVSKWEGLLFRIALIFHSLDTWSFWGSADWVARLEVSAATAGKVSRFVDFLMRHALRFYGEFYEPAAHTREARELAGWLLTRPESSTVTPRDIEKARRSLQGNRPLTLAAMGSLESAGWVTVEKRGAEGPSSWSVNPEIHRRFAERAEREKARRERERAKILAALSAQEAIRDAQ